MILTLAAHDEVYISGGDSDGFYPGAEFIIYRDEGRIVIPETRIDVGRLIQNVGVIEVTESPPPASSSAPPPG